MTPTNAIIASLVASAALTGSAVVAAQALGGANLSTVLTGAAEVPGPGDPDGRGEAVITLDPGKSRICWKISVKDIDTATGAHIHAGAAGSAPPNNVVLGLTAPSDGGSKGCETVKPALIDAIQKSPKSYYVNVHNATYPNGALRGQLG